MPIDFKALADEMERERADPEYKAQRQAEREQWRLEQLRRVNNVNNTVEQTDEFLDVDFGSAMEYVTLPTGSYDLEIIDLAIKEKSDNKRRSDLRLKQAEKPETTLEQIDAYQWVFTFRVIAGEYEGETLTERMTRSFHENSKAGKLAAAALGMPKYNVAQARQLAEQAGVKGSALLMGKRVRAFVTDDPDAQGRQWNNIKEISMIPAPRPRQRVQNGTGSPSVQLQGYSSPSGEDESLFEA